MLLLIQLELLQGPVVELLVPILLFDLAQKLTIVVAEVRLESAGLNRFNVLLEDLADGTVALLLQNIQEEHELVLTLLALLYFFAVVCHLVNRLTLQLLVALRALLESLLKATNFRPQLLLGSSAGASLILLLIFNVCNASTPCIDLATALV